MQEGEVSKPLPPLSHFTLIFTIMVLLSALYLLFPAAVTFTFYNHRYCDKEGRFFYFRDYVHFLSHFFGIDGVLAAGPIADLMVAAAAFTVVRAAFKKLGISE